MNCFVYKSLKKDDTYIFIPRQDDFSDIPELLIKSLGDIEQVMELELTPDRELARVTASEVMKNIDSQGFHLQMPPADPLTGKEKLL